MAGPKKAESYAERIDRWKRQAEEHAEQRLRALLMATAAAHSAEAHETHEKHLAGLLLELPALIREQLVGAYQQGHAAGRKEGEPKS